MIKTVTSFRKYIREKYGLNQDQLFSVRGINAVMLSDTIKLDEQDTEQYHPIFISYRRYNWQIIFLGIPKALLPQSQEEIIRLLGTTFEPGTYDTPLPQTYAAAERWFKRHDIKYTDRSFVSKGTLREVLHPMSSYGVEDNTPTHNEDLYGTHEGPWFLYETHIEDASRTLSKVAYITFLDAEGKDTQLIAIKAPGSKYIPLRKKLQEALMQQMISYEKLITLLATKQYDKASTQASTYMSLLFNRQGTVDIEALKKAYNEGTVFDFVKKPSNLISPISSEIDDMNNEMNAEINRLCPGEKPQPSIKHETSFEEEVERAQAKLKSMQETYNERERFDDVFVPGIGDGELQDDD